MPYRERVRGGRARARRRQSRCCSRIARQESRFIPDIVSSAGAHRADAADARRPRAGSRSSSGSGDYRPAQITDIDINTQFGAYYFKYWLERLDSQPALAAAAYNAGPGRAQAWRPPTPLEGAVWVETIPFNETRDYVKKVLANAMFYTRALGKPAVPLTVRLGVVSPRTPGTATSGSVAVVN